MFAEPDQEVHMETTRFTVRLSEGEWRTEPPDPSLDRALGHVFGHLARLDSVPAEVAVVGHVQLFGRWCAFLRPAGSARIEAALIDADRYARIGYDPFLIASRLFASEDLRRVVEGGSLPQVPAPPARPIPIASCGDYLPLAYARFLASELGERQELYVSVLPAGLPPEHSPLSCFTAEPEPPAPSPVRKPIPPAAPASATHPAPADPAGQDHSRQDWFDRPLAHTPEAETASVSPSPPAAAPDPTGPRPELAPAPHDDGRVAALERALRWRTIALAVTAAFLLGAIVLGIGQLGTLERRLADLDAGAARISTLTQGLGIPPEHDDPEAAIRARLYDLATVSVQSGAWNEGLRQRGVEPAEFLDRLVDLSREQPILSRVAASGDELLALSGRREPLLALADANAPLLALAVQSEALARLTAVEARLTAAAAVQPALERLAGRAEDLDALARRRADVEQLLGQAATLTSAAREVANLVVFMERHQRALEQLAQRGASLVELSAEQRHLIDLARKKSTLDALIASSDGLLALVDSPGLTRLAADDAAVEALTQDLDKLLELARHSQTLLEIVAERAQSARER